MEVDDAERFAEYASDIFQGLQESDCLQESDWLETEAPARAALAVEGAAVGGQQRGAPTCGDAEPPGRAALVAWLAEAHRALGLCAEVLFLAVGLVERFLRLRRVAEGELRLVGAAALLIAAKFEEGEAPDMRDITYIMDRAHAAEEVRLMELRMLSVLEFAVAGQTATHFMDRYLQANNCDELQSKLARYLLELTLTEDISCRYPAAHLAAGAVLLVNRLSGRQPGWPVQMVDYTGCHEAALAECAEELQRLARDAKCGASPKARDTLSQDPPLMQLVRTAEAGGA